MPPMIPVKMIVMRLVRGIAVLSQRARLPCRLVQAAPSPYGRALLPSARPMMQLQMAPFSASKKRKNRRKNKKGQQQPKKKKSKEQQKREDKERNFRREQYKKLKRMKGLHEAAKWKRILSACQYWFSKTNLETDYFMIRTLREYHGWMPISVLLTFPKFQHWTNTDLVIGALESSLGAKNFQVKYSQELCQTPNKFDAQMLSEDADDTDWRSSTDDREFDEVEEGEDQMRSSDYEDWIEEDWENFEEEGSESDDDSEDTEFIDEGESDTIAHTRRHLSASNWGYVDDDEEVDEVQGHATTKPLDEDEKDTVVHTQRHLSASNWGYVDDDDVDDDHEVDVVVEGHTTTTPLYGTFSLKDDSKPHQHSKHLAIEDDHNKVREGGDSEVDDSSEEFTDEEESETISHTQRDLSTYDWGDVDDDEVDELVQGHTQRDLSAYDWGDVDDDDEVDEMVQEHTTPPLDTSSLKDESKPQDQHLKYLVIEDDHHENPGFALVRHRKITLEYLDELHKASYDDDDDYDRLDFVDIYGDEISDEPTIPEKKKKKKQSSLPKYKTNRPVVVVNKPSKLKSFCTRLLESTDAFAKKSKDPALARCIGFDAEYCTLEHDIRGNLPAMIQMASPAPDGPIGLIWIDKFPNHGKDILTDIECKPLQDIFADSSLWKVGVKASGDVKNLARWFGTQNTVHIFSGIGDIERDEATPGDVRLAGMCESVLGMNLPKLKEKASAKQRERKKKGKRVPTAHWRRSNLTPLMKEYAAHDAACSVDIWIKLKDL